MNDATVQYSAPGAQLQPLPSSASREFFTVLLGDGLADGLYAHVWHLAGKHTDWIQTVDAAEASANRNGRSDVYFGTGLVGKPGLPDERVKIETAVGMLGLLVDIDIKGDAHKQDALPSDEPAALALLGEVEKPATISVNSGHGLQAWWLFAEPWRFAGEADKARAIRLSAAWQAHVNALARRHGWKLDSVGDLSRVLRVPGTFNAKQPDAKVSVLLLDAMVSRRYTPEELEALCTPADYHTADDAIRASSEASTVDPQQRFTQSQPCPVCGGHKDIPQGIGARCWGFVSRDGEVAFCTREDLSGGMSEHVTSIGPVYVHRMRGPCGCGATHGDAKVYALNDGGNAQRLLDAGGRNHLLYVPKRQFPWHLWDENCWPQDREQRVGKWMEEMLRTAYAATWRNGQPRAAQTEEARFLLRAGDERGIAGALAVASRHVSVLPDVFDTHDWYLPCNNSLTYDLEAGQVIRSLPDHRMTRCVPVPALWGPAPHPRWDAVLRLVMGDDLEMVDYLRRMLGLCVTGCVGEKAFWFWQGPTNAGKTTVLTFLSRLLGPFVYSIPLRALLKQRQDTGILHDIAGIRGMRLVYAEEFKPGDVLDSAWVKKISGEGDTTADRKGEPNETFRSTAKLIIGTNELPALSDVDGALRGRVRVVPFVTNIPEAMRKAEMPLQSVDEVVSDLMSEAPAILYDLVHAVGEWRAAGKQLGMPQAVAQASKQYLDNQDPLIEWFEACFVKEPDGSLTKQRVEYQLKLWYWSFLTQSGWADSKALYQRFGDMLTAKGFTKRAAYDGKRFTGPLLTREAVSVALDAVARADAKTDVRQRYANL